MNEFANVAPMWRGELVHSNNGETDVPVAIYGLHCCPRKYSELRPVERTGRISHGKTSLVGGYCMNLQRISGFLYWFYLICRFRCQKSQRFRSKRVKKNMNIKTRMEAYAANTWQPTYQSIWWYIPVFFSSASLRFGTLYVTAQYGTSWHIAQRKIYSSSN